MEWKWVGQRRAQAQRGVRRQRHGVEFTKELPITIACWRCQASDRIRDHIHKGLIHGESSKTATTVDVLFYAWNLLAQGPAWGPAQLSWEMRGPLALCPQHLPLPSPRAWCIAASWSHLTLSLPLDLGPNTECCHLCVPRAGQSACHTASLQ